jgi:prevent-host-death family protein
MISLEEATLDNCVNEAQHERVIITRNGKPVALIVGVEGMDEEQLLLGSSDKFWQFINERRKQYTITRAKLEQTINDKSASRVGPKNRRIE